MKGFSFRLHSKCEQTYTIQEIGIVLPSEDFSKLKVKLRNLEHRGPSFSILKLILSQEGEMIHGELNISGGDKSFRATHSSLDLWMLYQKLESEIDGQLLKWKKARFTRTDTYLSNLKEEKYHFSSSMSP